MLWFKSQVIFKAYIVRWTSNCLKIASLYAVSSENIKDYRYCTFWYCQVYISNSCEIKESSWNIISRQLKGIVYNAFVVYKQEAHMLLKYNSKALLNSDCDFLLIDFFTSFQGWIFMIHNYITGLEKHANVVRSNFSIERMPRRKRRSLFFKHKISLCNTG